MDVPIFIWFLMVLAYCIIATMVKCEMLGVARLNDEPSNNYKLAIKMAALVWPVTIPCMAICVTVMTFLMMELNDG